MHLRLSDLERAIFADIVVPTLANDVYHDKEQIGCKFCCQICRISDPIVSILILHAPELGNIKANNQATEKTGLSTI